jgi:hypothetical protein
MFNTAGYFIRCRCLAAYSLTYNACVSGTRCQTHFILCCCSIGLVLITEYISTHDWFISSSFYSVAFDFVLDNSEKFWAIVLKWSVVIRRLYIRGEALKGVISSLAKK